METWLIVALFIAMAACAGVGGYGLTVFVPAQRQPGVTTEVRRHYRLLSYLFAMLLVCAVVVALLVLLGFPPATPASAAEITVVSQAVPGAFEESLVSWASWFGMAVVFCLLVFGLRELKMRHSKAREHRAILETFVRCESSLKEKKARLDGIDAKIMKLADDFPEFGGKPFDAGQVAGLLASGRDAYQMAEDEFRNMLIACGTKSIENQEISINMVSGTMSFVLTELDTARHWSDQADLAFDLLKDRLAREPAKKT